MRKPARAAEKLAAREATLKGAGAKNEKAHSEALQSRDEAHAKRIEELTAAHQKTEELESAISDAGTKLDEAAMEKLATACAAACNPIDDKRGTVEFRTEVAGVLAQRAAKIAYQRAGGK